MKNKSQRIWTAIALFQLVLVTAGAAQLPIGALPVIGRPLQLFADMSGAGIGYGFFSPGVYAQIRTVIDIYDHKGNKTTEFMNQGPNREVNLRLNDVIESFLNEFGEDKMRVQRALAASFAGSVFARKPQAEKVEVRVERYTAPSRKNYLAGQSAAWEELYSAQFIHSPLSEKK